MAEHLSEEQLARFQDGELPAREASHLERCSECNGRLRDLQASSAAYATYRDSLPTQSTPKPWRSITALQADYESRRSRRSWLWWQVPAAAALVCLVVASVTIWRRPERLQAGDLLARSAHSETPSDRMISMRVRGRTLLRPAVLTMVREDERDADMAHVRNLFVEAHYDWGAPLSARSFQGWRGGLRDRQDTVSVIDAGSPEEAYRVRTDTATGVLRSASLTLRGKELRATDGSFQFEGEDVLEVGEASAPGAKISSKPRPANEEPAAETPASPADTLHVLAALNEIGADVAVPIVVSEDDQHHVVVRATGLSASRRQEVAAALQPLAHVRLELDAVPSNSSARTHAETAERYSTGMPGAVRQQMEDRLGGAMSLQQLTDNILESCGMALARTHALETLAGKFPAATERKLTPADRQLLHMLRERHVTELQRLAAAIRADLKPLLPAATPAADRPSPSPWQTGVSELLAAAQSIDDALNGLLAGSYSQSQGEAILQGLNGQLERLERTIQFQASQLKQDEGR